MRNSTGPLLDELDWPQYSFSTGFKNISEPDLINVRIPCMTDSINIVKFCDRILMSHIVFQVVISSGSQGHSRFTLLAYATMEFM